MVIREILHNDDNCTQFYEPYCRQFERLLHAVAVKTSVYDVESCIILADLVEEYLSSLILSHSLTKQTVEIQKDKVIDWQFWIHVIQRMLSSDNSHTELRALAFLFNIWDNIPIGCNPGGCATDVLSSGKSGNGGAGNLEFSVDENEGLRWNVIVWLLSPVMWERYFCHWQPLVRAYYHRLLCWRVASVGPESDLLSSILYSNCNADARILLAQRLESSHEKVLDAIELSKESKSMFPPLEPAPPVVNRQLTIFLNPAVATVSKVPSESNIANAAAGNNSNTVNKIPRASSEGALSSQHLHRVNPFDVFDDVAYSYPPMASPKDNFFMLGKVNNNEDHSEEVEDDTQKRRWSLLRSSQGLKRYFSSGNVRMSVDLGNNELRPTKSKSTVKNATPPSPTSSLTMSLIPPPPQLLRERPEVNRPPYKFGLEYSEKIARKQVDLIMRKNRGVSVEDSTMRTPTRPRLPFDYERKVETMFVYSQPSEAAAGNGTVEHDEEEDDVYKTCVSEFEFDSDFELSPLIDLDNTTLEDITDAYGSNTEGDVSDEITGVEIVDSLIHEEKLQRILLATETTILPTGSIGMLKTNSDDSKYWKYAGRSLSEWSQAVQQFEEFVRSRRMMGGVTRLEDLGVPFFVAEIPAKVLAG